MAASYPSSAKAFTTKTTAQTIDASHVNDLQQEVTAIEQDLIAGLPASRGGTGNTTLTANRVLLGNGTSAVAVAGAGTAGQVLTSNGASAPTFETIGQRQMCGGRLSLTTAVPVTTADVTAATTLYWVPYTGNQIALYSGSAWVTFNQAELSIAVPATTNQMYDVFVDYNSGTPALSVTAWTNDTTRATALTTQDGVLVLTGSTGKRYVGSFRTTGVSGQTEDSLTKRYVWNYYHRVSRPLRRLETTASWNYTTATWRQANGSTSNQVEVVIGVAEDAIALDLNAYTNNNTGANNAGVGIGEDSTTASASGYSGGWTQTQHGELKGTLVKIPAVGYHYYAWLEYAVASNTNTWYGATIVAGGGGNGLSGVVRG